MKLMLDGPRAVTIVPSDDRPVGDRDIRLRSLISGISHGTELNLYRGTAPTLTSRFDLDLRAYLPREHDDRPAYPTTLGYELVAEVVEVGDGVEHVRPGDVVHVGLPHQDGIVIDVDVASRLGYPLVVLPPGLSPDRAIFVSLASVALVAVHDAAPSIGDSVAVFGLGAIGQLTVQLLRLAGVGHVIGVDPVEERRRLASASGADSVIDPGSEPRAGVRIKQLLRRGTDIGIETSATSSALHEAITAVTVGGRIVSVAYYQGAASGLRLGEEWHINRPDMVSSMGLWDCPHRKAPAWDRPRITATVVDLLHTGRLCVDDLLTDRFAFTDATDAYRYLDTAPSDAIRAAFTY